jgi:hypothetical protein
MSHATARADPPSAAVAAARYRYARLVRVRVIELRILGAVLAGLWVVACALIVVGYRPGGPVDVLVGIAAGGPTLVAAAAVVWPPVARSPRAFAVMAWLAMVPILLLVPSIAGVVTQLEGRGPQTLLPSAEAVYPWVLALLATGVFAGLGVARRRLGDRAPRRRRLLAGVGLGVAATLLAGSAFAAAAVFNELSLGDRPAISSRFGPTDPALDPPRCDGPLTVGATAAVTLQADVAVDGSPTGQLAVAGQRSGMDVRWDGYVTSRVAFGRTGFARIGSRAWSLFPNGGWVALAPAQAQGGDMDRQLLLEALTPARRAVVEDVGLAYIEGARARHCRVALDGIALRRGVPEVSTLVGDADLARWRGELDFWVFADAELGQADGVANGPALELSPGALSAEVRFRLTAMPRSPSSRRADPLEEGRPWPRISPRRAASESRASAIGSPACSRCCASFTGTARLA